MGISQEEFYDLTWDVWEYKVWHYRIQLARRQEPFRDLQAQLHNMLAEKNEKLPPHEIMWLLTDRFAAHPNPQAELGASKALWERLKAQGRF